MHKTLIFSFFTLSAFVTLLASKPLTSISFDDVSIPVTDEQKRAILHSNSVSVKGVEHNLSYNTIARSGDMIRGNIFGLIYDKKGKPIINKDGTLKISSDNDFSSLHKVGKKIFMISHFETRPAAMYLTELNQDKTTGKLTPINTQNINFSEFNGLHVPCAGSVTPWNSHLGSEEYPADMRLADSAGHLDETYDAMGEYFGGNLKAVNHYNYGWIPEVQILRENGDMSVQKHYAMGRFSHELAYVMPDQKTVYLSDDNTNGTFFKFIALKQKDLSRGELFAAKWIQTSSEHGGKARIKWISLGNARDSAISKILKKKPLFKDIFKTANRDSNNKCPSSFTASNYAGLNECLKIKKGMNLVASRLESGRYASIKGATTEFSKMEGITYNPQDNNLYMSIGKIDNGMENNHINNKVDDKRDKGGNNDIMLDYNRCGVVYRMELNGYDVVSMEGLVVGTPMDKDLNGNSCNLNNISMPDNLTFIPNTDTLIIGEDTNYHQNDMMWAFNLTKKQLTRIQTTPYGAETTSPYYYPDINGFGYLISVVQHPYGESDSDKLNYQNESKAYTGYIGPFPVIK
jgi:secreted PhoX family phosphatase